MVQEIGTHGKRYNKEDCWMIIYVDDILLIGNSEQILEEIKTQFNAKDIGEAKTFLGMDIHREKDKITLKQTNLIDKILDKLEMTNCNGISRTMEINFNVTSETEVNVENQYRELIGSLLYLIITSRPDLTYSVSYLSRYLDKANTQTWKAGKRILIYLKETKEKGLIFKKCKDTHQPTWIL